MKTIIDVKSYGKINTKKTWLIYHGSEPKTFGEGISKQSARSRFPSLLQKNIDRIALAFGFTSVANHHSELFPQFGVVSCLGCKVRLQELFSDAGLMI